MPDTAPPPPPTPPAVPVALPPVVLPEHSRPSGCLKWGLVGCAGLSVFLIVALMILGNKAGSMVEWALVKLSDQVEASCTPEVTAADKEAYREAYRPFVEKAKKGKVSPDEMTAFRTRVLAAVADGKVTPDEIHGLTAVLHELAK